MTDLKSQPSPAPTRKMLAVIIATFVVQGFLGVLEAFWPGIAALLPAQEWIAAMVPIIAGYMTHERA